MVARTQAQVAPFKSFGAKLKHALAVGLSYIDSSEDADRVLSYYTRQQVQFLDYRLGCMFFLIQLVMAAFLVGYVVVYKEGYLKFEEAKGLTVTHITGDVVSTSIGAPGTRYFSTEDLTYPGLENGNTFIATRQTVHRQTRGTCEDIAMPCVTDADCTSGGQGKCTDLGYCRERSWCNIQAEPEIYHMESDKLQLWARSAIQYVKLAPDKVFGTDREQNATFPTNTFSVRQLLSMCDPLPVNYEEVAELGAVFDVTFRYDCNVKKDACKPEVLVRRLDTMFDPDNIGFGFNYAEHIDEDVRVLNEVQGLRFLFRTNGRGKRTSMSALITTVSTSGTLLSIAAVIADLLLTRVLANRRKYIARKFEKTTDFSEFLETQQEKMSLKPSKVQTERIEQQTIDRERKWMAKFEEGEEG